MSSIILKKNSAHGYHKISIEVHKEHFRFTGRVITEDCNSSLQLGEFPKELQLAKVKFLYKTGDKNLINNFTSFSKTFEKIAT